MKIRRETASEDLLSFREVTGMTQAQLSKKTGVAKGTIVSAETKKRTPRVTTLGKLNKYVENIA